MKEGATHVSLDIECCGDVLMSLGAVQFDPITGVMGKEFYAALDIGDQLARGLRVDAGAFRWWLHQSDAARNAVIENQEPAVSVLQRFETWMPKPHILWAYPTSFDLPIIERVYRAYGLRTPWRWTETMDARTLWKLAIMRDPEMARIEKEAPTIPHHALEDAKEQARWIVKYLGAIRPPFRLAGGG